MTPNVQSSGTAGHNDVNREAELTAPTGVGSGDLLGMHQLDNATFVLAVGVK